ncbi:hypothetical protein G9C98_002249 [Cotesia typhae]|uniref:Uncharacterized protein n=1 Tax=Cotesia typhae TaxID=2053667 RepID=A0A8J5QY89_9HYME|nr:hypothetical protein G9C98_002249 [Cotesia typhae]
MISPKSVIITLPKGLQKSPVISPVRNIIKPTGNLNFTTSILATKSKVDAKNMQKIQHDCYGDVQGWGNSTGTVPNTVSKCGNSVEDIDALPHLEELFADIQSDGYVERLEELAESLLREVTAGVEAHAQRPNEQVTIKKDTFEEFDDSKKMVGPASKNVEASPICSSLILYPKESTPFPAQYVDKSSIPELFKRQVKIKQEPVSDVDTVYGTYDEATNCITIIYPGEDDAIRIDECVQEVSSDESANLTPNYYNNVSPFYSIADSMSPSSMHSDDSDANSVCYKMKSNISNCGYESHDFPQAERHTDTATPIDLWHESFSELFPSLV